MIFTTVNMMEFVRGSEAVGRRKGLGQLDTVQDASITLWGGLQRLAGKRLAFGSTVYEDVTILENGTATMADQTSSIDAAVTGASGAALLASDIGAEFLYVQVPGKERDASEFPKGVTDYSIQKYDEMVDTLSAMNIPVLGMREVIQQDMVKTGNDWMDYFYKTDHHWQNKAAFLAYQNICETMKNAGMEINEEAIDSDNYSKSVYEQIFLGTHGRMAGPLYTGLDDYELWLPNFETDFVLDVPSQGIHKEGSFEQCFVNYENLEHYSYDYYAYYAYLKEDYECFEIHNKCNKDGAHVIIVRDSEAVPVSVFLANQCSELDILDLRYMSDNYAVDYIREKKPDMLLYIFGTGYLANENAMIIK